MHSFCLIVLAMVGPLENEWADAEGQRRSRQLDEISQSIAAGDDISQNALAAGGLLLLVCISGCVRAASRGFVSAVTAKIEKATAIAEAAVRGSGSHGVQLRHGRLAFGVQMNAVSGSVLQY